MKTPGRFTLAVLLALPIVACSGPTEPDSHSFVYPLAVGNRWVYGYTETRTYNDGTPPDTVGYPVTVTVISSKVIQPGTIAYTMQASGVTADGDTIRASRTYINRPDGMYLYSRSGFGPMMPKAGPLDNPGLVDNGSTEWMFPLPALPFAASVSSDVEIFDPPQRVLAYPQTVGTRWTVTDPSTGHHLFENVVTDRVAVTVPAGTFGCIDIDWLYLNFGDYGTSSKIASVGLVSRTDWVINAHFTNPDYPDEPGKRGSLSRTYELKSYAILPAMNL